MQDVVDRASFVNSYGFAIKKYTKMRIHALGLVRVEATIK